MSEEARRLLGKAERALHAAEVLLAAGDAEFAAGRAYYAMLCIPHRHCCARRGCATASTGAFMLPTGSTLRRQAFWTRDSIGGYWTPSISGCLAITALRPRSGGMR